MIGQIFLKSFYRVLTGLLLVMMIFGISQADEMIPDPFGIPDEAMLKSITEQQPSSSVSLAAVISIDEARRAASIPSVPALRDQRSADILPEEKKVLPVGKIDTSSPQVSIPVSTSPPVKLVSIKNTAPESTAKSFAGIEPPPRFSIEGIYDTGFNEMTLHLNGNQVTGTYKFKNGKIEGILQGNTLVGKWRQSNGSGRLEFVFTDDFSSFTGKWSYNDKEPNSKWDGKKTGSLNFTAAADNTSATNLKSIQLSGDKNNRINGVFHTDFNEMTLHLNGNQVTGTYKFKNGKIEGILQGNTLVGKWRQSNGSGRLEFVFTDDFSSFTGKWSYNDKEPNSKWDGKKTGSGS